MTRNNTPPDVFAVIQTMTNPVSLQFLKTNRGNVIQGVQTYSVENVEWADDMMNIPHAEYTYFQTLDTNIYTLVFPPNPQNPTSGFQREKYWYLPIFFIHHSQRIPVIEFQYKSWLPSNHSPLIPICYEEEHIINDMLLPINQARCDTISRQEETARRAQAQAPRTPPPRPRRQSPPPAPQRNRRPQQQREEGNNRLNILLEVARSFDRAELTLGEDLESIRMRLDRLDGHVPRPPPLNLQGLINEEELLSAQTPPRHEPPPVVLLRALPLPKHIGDILIAHAKSGTDTCPISANAYSECTSLAVTSCYHVFDSASLATWQATHNTCPVCRLHITNTVIG